MPKLELPQAKLVDKITSDWKWVLGMYTSMQQSTALRDNCVSARMTVQSYVSMARDAQLQAETTVTRLTAPPPAVVGYKERAMHLRRNYSSFIVAGVAALSIVPAVRAGPGRLEKARVAVRNLLFFGGGSCFVLFPEFAFPALSRTQEVISSSASRAMSKP